MSHGLRAVVFYVRCKLRPLASDVFEWWWGEAKWFRKAAETRHAEVMNAISAVMVCRVHSETAKGILDTGADSLGRANPGAVLRISTVAPLLDFLGVSALNCRSPRAELITSDAYLNQSQEAGPFHFQRPWRPGLPSR